MTTNRSNSRRHLTLKIFIQLCIASLLCALLFTLQQSELRGTIEFLGRYSKKDVVRPWRHKGGILEESWKSENKHILVWTNYFSQERWLPSPQSLNCSVQTCDVTFDRSLLPNSSAVIVHWRNLDPNDVPVCDECPPLVLFNKEAPPHAPTRLNSSIADKIVWTVTYRRDSDVFAPYGWIANRTTEYVLPNVKNRTKKVCWLVSHCDTPSNREGYAESLSKFIDVEIYGHCGQSKPCPHELVLDCYRWLSERCLFYLSFENAVCRDYVTEKLFYALMTDMVPIVMGGDDYAAHLPPHSFIDVAAYPGPEALAGHLHALVANETLYLEYFGWKATREARFVAYAWLCDLCGLLHRTDLDRLRPKRDVLAWWLDAEVPGRGNSSHSRCRAGDATGKR